ncbi:MAG: ParB N-terminal domain-containing protein [SAR324 cluster bacterium]|nr:ParB N-terminal domain-containing protein [SAR324 cluster bacterium]
MGRKKKELKDLQEIALDRIFPPTDGHGAQASEEAIARAGEALRETGEMDPLVVREAPESGRFHLITGTPQFLFAKTRGQERVTCLVLKNSLKREIAVIEALHRGEADPWELADALQKLKDQRDWTQAQLGIAVGRTRDFVANILAIVQIAPETRRFIIAHRKGRELSARHLRYVARAARSEQLQIAQHILANKLSTTELEREKRGTTAKIPEYRFIMVRERRRPGSPLYPRSPKDWRRYFRQLATDLRRVDRLETQEIRRSRKQISEAKLRQRIIKREAKKKRTELGRELRLTVKHLERMGGF